MIFFVKKYIFFFLVVLIFLLFNISFFNNEKEEYFSYFINNNATASVPLKTDRYQFSHSVCNNGASIIWDTDVWGPTITNLNQSRTKCEIYFKDPYIVTFDPDGGEVDVTSKEVRYGLPYGDLPVPTKEGYTFKGWNGKNMFDEEKLLLAISGVRYENGFYIFTSRNIYNKYGNGNYLPIDGFLENTRYTISIYGYTGDPGWSYNFWVNYVYSDESNSFDRFNLDEFGLFSFTSLSNKTIDRITISYNASTTNYVSHIQLEKGETSTEFEPYYVTSSTKVVQQQNHTLKAIWEAN